MAVINQSGCLTYDRTFVDGKPSSIVMFDAAKGREVISFKDYSNVYKGETEARHDFVTGQDMFAALGKIREMACEIFAAKQGLQTATTMEQGLSNYKALAALRGKLRDLLLPQITVKMSDVFKEAFPITKEDVQTVLNARMKEMSFVESSESLHQEQESCLSQIVEVENMIIRGLNELNEDKLWKLCQGHEVYSEYLLCMSHDPCANDATHDVVGYKLKEGIKFSFGINCDLYVRPEKEGGYTFSLIYLNSVREVPVEFASLHFYKENNREGSSFCAVAQLSMGRSFQLSTDYSQNFQKELFAYFIQLAQESIQKQEKSAVLKFLFYVYEPVIDVPGGNQSMQYKLYKSGVFDYDHERDSFTERKLVAKEREDPILPKSFSGKII